MQEGDILRFTLPENEDSRKEVREFALDRLEKSVKFEGTGTVISVTDEEIICRVDKVELSSASEDATVTVEEEEEATESINITIVSG